MKTESMVRTAVLGIALLFAFAPARAGGAEFEVASIKLTKLPTGVRGGCHGRDAHFRPTDAEMLVPLGRCVITAGRLTHIMAIAYSIDVNRIGGRPEWENGLRFDVDAKAENTAATQEQLLQMLQSLLADRFRLKASRETKQESGYALVVAKNGPKLKQARDGEESRLTVHGASISKLDAIDGKNLAVNTITGQATPLSQVLEVLSRAAGGEVIDQTGLTGSYDFMLTWEPTESISNALQQQLGLKLEAQKVPVEYMTIVSAEKPTDN